VCYDFNKKYSIGVGLTYVSILATTIIGMGLRYVLVFLSKYEAHKDKDEEQASAMIKLFQSGYAISVIIVLIAYGGSPSTPQFLRRLGIFAGPYTDFDRPWYGNIGFLYMVSFILQSFTPLAYNLVEYYFINPVLRMYHHSLVRSLLSTSIVMQYDLNQIEVGPVFDSTDHTAQLLILLFFAMTFAPGLPLLMPLMCLVFSLYFRVDKFLLCRHYQKPPQLGPSAIKVVTAYLPYAAIIRLAVACWMYGNHNILYIHKDPYSNTKYSPIARHLLRSNVLPLFILLLLIFATVLLTKVFGALQLDNLLKSLTSLLQQLTSSISLRITAWDSMVNEHGRIHRWDLVKSGDPNRKEVAGFTKDYFMFVKHRDEIPDTCIAMFSYYYLTKLDASEIEDGWIVRNEGDFVIKLKCIKDHQDPATGEWRLGNPLKTYDVIGDHRCNSYDVEKVPSYVTAMKGLREGTNSLIEVQRKAQNEKNVVLNFDAFDSLGHFESNVVDNYNRRKESKGHSVMDEDRLIHGIEKAKPSTSAAAYHPNASKVAPSQDISQHITHSIDQYDPHYIHSDDHQYGGSEHDDSSSHEGGQHPKKNKKKAKKEKTLPPIKLAASPKVKYHFEDDDYVYPDPETDKRPRGNYLMNIDSFTAGVGGLVD